MHTAGSSRGGDGGGPDPGPPSVQEQQWLVFRTPGLAALAAALDRAGVAYLPHGGEGEGGGEGSGEGLRALSLEDPCGNPVRVVAAR